MGLEEDDESDLLEEADEIVAEEQVWMSEVDMPIHNRTIATQMKNSINEQIIPQTNQMVDQASQCATDLKYVKMSYI